jgi:hypothetical protein
VGESSVDRRNKCCPICRGAVTAALDTPAEPDYWVRLAHDGGWEVSKTAPRADERSLVAVYECGSCGMSLQLLVTTEQRSPQR